MPGAELVRALRRAGWYEDRQVGSHKQLRHPDRPGTLGGILRDAGLTADELRALL